MEERTLQVIQSTLVPQFKKLSLKQGDIVMGANVQTTQKSHENLYEVSSIMLMSLS